MLTRTSRVLAGWFASIGWQGWGTLVSVLTLFATVAVAVLLFRLSEQGEQERFQASQASLVVSASLRHDPGRGEWVAQVNLTNLGPATTGPVRIEVETGGVEVRPASELAMWRQASMEPIDHAVDWYSQRSGKDGTDRECFDNWILAHVRDVILPGDEISLSQSFEVSTERTQGILRQGDFQPIALLQEDGSYVSGAVLDWGSANPDNGSVVGDFVRSISVVGSNTSFFHTWRENYGECSAGSGAAIESAF